MTVSSSNFLTSISGQKQLYEITVPGSHDAGVYAGDAKSLGLFGRKASAVCQSFGFFEQARAGSRFFDVRIKARKDTLVAHHSKAGQGAIGGELNTLMGDMERFLTVHKNQFLIARFTKCSGHAEIVKTIKDKYSGKLYKGSGNIAKAKLHDVRGKIIAVFDDDFNQWIDQKQGFHPFGKFGGSATKTGLATCGHYSGSTNMLKVYMDQWEKVHDHHSHPAADHLSVLYWTQTSGLKNIEGFTTGKGGSHDHMRAGLQSLRDDIPDAAIFTKNRGKIAEAKHLRKASGLILPKMPNIIMYDFVNAETSRAIIELNFSPTQIVAAAALPKKAA